MYADLNRTRRLMAEMGVDALLVTAPENFTYITGVQTLLTYFQHPGLTSLAVLPADERAAPAVIVADVEERAIRRRSWIQDVRSHPLWTDGDDVTAFVERDPNVDIYSALDAVAQQKPKRRSGHYDMQVVMRLLVDALQECRLADGRIGIELEFLPTSEYFRIREALPAATIVDSTALFRRLRLIKTPPEIHHIRTATRIAEQAMDAAARAANPETLTGDVFRTFQHTALDIARQDSVDGLTHLELGRTRCGPEPWVPVSPRKKLESGDIIQFDTGVRVSGYRSDIGRTYVYGKIRPQQQQVHDALEAGWHAAMEQLKPGRRYRDVFLAAEQAVRGAGLRSYLRGHIGHSLGLDKGEEPPAITRDEETLLEPGMVLAVEIPYYLNGVGGFQIEDNLVITETGYERFSELPPQLVAVG